MVTHWRALIPKIAEETGKSEEYVKDTIELYTKTLTKGINNFENVEYDLFYLGKLFLSEKKYNRMLAQKKDTEFSEEKQKNLDRLGDKLKIIKSQGRQPGKPKKSFKRNNYGS